MFYVGQKVVCVDDRILSQPGAQMGFTYIVTLDGLKEGSYYTIRDIYFDSIEKHDIVCVEEIKRPFDIFAGREGGFRAARFRPLTEKKKQTDISIFTDMLDRINGVKVTA